MQTVTLVPKEQFKISVEAETITPDNFAGKSADEIGAVVAYEGNTPRPLSELLDIKVKGRTDAVGNEASNSSYWESHWPMRFNSGGGL